VKVALDVSAVPEHVAGAGRYVVELARRLPEREVATTLITRRNDVDRWTTLSPRADRAALVPSARVARLISEAWLLGRSRTARDNDLWHAPHYTMPHRRVSPCVVTIHDLTFFTNPEWHERSKVAFFRRAIRYSAQHARVLVSVSHYTARLLDEIVPTHAPVVVAPLGVELTQFQPDSSDDGSLFQSRGLSLDIPYIFFVGTVEPRKGLDVLLDAFATLASEIDDVELWLAGQGGWGTGLIEAQIAAHPYAARIRRLGFVEDKFLPALYRQSRVVAYPSRGEGFGLPVLEAMACGAQVITTVGTVMADVAGNDARLVSVGDAIGLADELRVAIAASDDERSGWSSRARTRAEEFTWDACVDQHLVAYEQAVG
jgi:glycosyltransferase involved in cell wall biosynthesis